MARHEPLGRAAPGAPPGMKITVRLGPDGKPHVVAPPVETTETTEAAERPPIPDDPRTANMRNVPPFGGGA
jgi:hypothetical protein